MAHAQFPDESAFDASLASVGDATDVIAMAEPIAGSLGTSPIRDSVGRTIAARAGASFCFPQQLPRFSQASSHLLRHLPWCMPLICIALQNRHLLR